MQSLMGETTAVAHGGNPQDRAAFPRPRCIPDIAFIGLMRYTLFFTSSLFPAPCSRLDAKREWGKPRQTASGGNPRRSALAPQDRAASLVVVFRLVLEPN
ncbi:MAG: hypothetical protein F6K26_33700 [Moorea sp. SIO2I5]|nr:hypothetical protein [Moorena sp. SIO2I5]